MTASALPLRDGANRRFAAVAGLVGVGGNVLGVLCLRHQPSAYRLAGLERWADQARAEPVATVASALCFSVGLLGLAVWARELGASAPTKRERRGTELAAAASVLNAAGSLLPIAVALQSGACTPACEVNGQTLLRLSLSVDALFNLGLGVGLVLFAVPPGRDSTRWLALAAGAASVPVAGQALWDPAAKLLAVAGPLWLALVLKTSVAWLFRHAERT